MSPLPTYVSPTAPLQISKTYYAAYLGTSLHVTYGMCLKKTHYFYKVGRCSHWHGVQAVFIWALLFACSMEACLAVLVNMSFRRLPLLYSRFGLVWGLRTRLWRRPIWVVSGTGTDVQHKMAGPNWYWWG